MARETRNQRYRRMYWTPPDFHHWNNHDTHDGQNRWIIEDRDHLRHVPGTTVQAHYYWAGLNVTPNNWEGIARRTGEPLPGEKGMKVRVRVSFEITGATAGNCAVMIQENLGSYYGNGEHIRTVDVSSTSASQFYGFSLVPSSDFDGTISLPRVDSIQRLG